MFIKTIKAPAKDFHG